MRTVAALYVDTARGPYPRMTGVDCWGFATKRGLQVDAFAPTRDAMTYDGPHPVVAHPPCGPWGRFRWRYSGGEGSRRCAIRAVEQARAFGGVVEHPAASSLWDFMGLPKPGEDGEGMTLNVQQCDWSHPARKPTWLFVSGIERDALPAFPAPREPTHVVVRHDYDHLPRVNCADIHLTPPLFAEWLVDLARRCRP